MKCVNSSSKKSKFCIGSLDKQITIQGRALRPTTDGGYTEDFTDTHTGIWADVKTRSMTPWASMLDVGQTDAYTHIFTIRKEYALTSEDWVEFDGVKFDITGTQDPNEGGEYLNIYARKKGNAKGAWK